MEDKIKTSLCRAVSLLPQPNFNTICTTPIVKMKEHDEITMQTPKRLPVVHKAIAYVSAVAAVFALCCCAYIFQYASAVSFIEYSVNPSFEISVTRAQTVFKITPKNKDAENFLIGRSYKGQNIEKVVESLTLSMIEEGFLTSENNIINISVDGKNAQTLEQLLFADIDTMLKEIGVEATITISSAQHSSANDKENVTLPTSQQPWKKPDTDSSDDTDDSDETEDADDSDDSNDDDTDDVDDTDDFDDSDDLDDTDETDDSDEAHDISEHDDTDDTEDLDDIDEDTDDTTHD